MRLPELWIWLDGVTDLDNVSSDRSYFSLPGQEVIPHPAPTTIFPSTPEPSSTGPPSTTSILKPERQFIEFIAIHTTADILRS